MRSEGRGAEGRRAEGRGGVEEEEKEGNRLVARERVIEPWRRESRVRSRREGEPLILQEERRGVGRAGGSWGGYPEEEGIILKSHRVFANIYDRVVRDHDHGSSSSSSLDK